MKELSSKYSEKATAITDKYNQSEITAKSSADALAKYELEKATNISRAELT